MPLLMRYPAAIAAGQIVDELVLNLDFAPTFLDFASRPIPRDMQGRSLRPLMDGSPKPAWRDAIYYRYYEYPHGWHAVRPHYGIRTDRYKLIHFEGDVDHWELYDLEADPQEMQNLYGIHGYHTIQEELHGRLAELRQELKDPS